MEVIMNRNIFIIFAVANLLAAPCLVAGSFARFVRGASHALEAHAPQLRAELQQATRRTTQEIQALREIFFPSVRNSVTHSHPAPIQPSSLGQSSLSSYYGSTIVQTGRRSQPSSLFHSLHTTPLPRSFHSSYPVSTPIAGATNSLLVEPMTNEQLTALVPSNPATPQQRPVAFTGFNEEDDLHLNHLYQEKTETSSTISTDNDHVATVTNDLIDQHTIKNTILTPENIPADTHNPEQQQHEEEHFHARTFTDEEVLLFDQEEPFPTFIPEEAEIHYTNNQTETPAIPEINEVTVYKDIPSDIATIPDSESSALTVISSDQPSALTHIEEQSQSLATIPEKTESALITTQNTIPDDLADVFALLFKKEEATQFTPPTQQEPLALPAGPTPLMLAAGTTPLLLDAGIPAATLSALAPQTLETIIEENAPSEAQKQLNNLINPALTNPFLAPVLFTAALAAATFRKKPVSYQKALTAGRPALSSDSKQAIHAPKYKQIVRTSTTSLAPKPQNNKYRLPKPVEQTISQKSVSTTLYKAPSLKPSSRSNAIPSSIRQTPTQPATSQPTLEALNPQRYNVNPVRRTVTHQPVAPLRATLPESVRTQKITITTEQPSQKNVYRIPAPTKPAPTPQIRALPEPTPSTLPVQSTQPVTAPRRVPIPTPSALNPTARSVAINTPSLVRPLTQARLPQTSLRNFTTAARTTPPTTAPQHFPHLTPSTSASLPAAPTTTTPPTAATPPTPPAATPTAATPSEPETTEPEADLTPQQAQKTADNTPIDDIKTETPTKDIPFKKEKEVAQTPLDSSPVQEKAPEINNTAQQKNGKKNLDPYELVLRHGKSSPVFVHGKEKQHNASTSTTKSSDLTTKTQHLASSSTLTVRSGLDKDISPSAPSEQSDRAKSTLFDHTQVKKSTHKEKRTIHENTFPPVKHENNGIKHTVTKETKVLETTKKQIPTQSKTIVSIITDTVSFFTQYIQKALQSLKVFFRLNDCKS